LQFSRNFTFRDAERLVPYLHALGVSHVYASPYLKARAGSSHGYDITDYNALNVEIGSEADAMVAALARHGMGQILDIVPNHMGVGGADNAWWLDVLEWGQASPYADFFDIGWNAAKLDLRGKVLLPFLGDHYGRPRGRHTRPLLRRARGQLQRLVPRAPLSPRTAHLSGGSCGSGGRRQQNARRSDGCVP
jgi:(1->4)-alpha-D-glucan 1-alpha-D-glucosylmutase